jgi:hypothetical protein
MGLGSSLTKEVNISFGLIQEKWGTQRQHGTAVGIGM